MTFYSTRPTLLRGSWAPTLLAFEALTLAVFSALHLSGALRIGAGTSYGAGFAEALIGIALAAGALASMRAPARARGRSVALGALAFAIFGFLVGLTFTVDSGDTVDLAYHLAMLPVLAATAALVTRERVHNSQKLS